MCLVNVSLSWCLIRWTAPWTQRRVSVLEWMGIPPLKSSAMERKLDLMMAPEQQVDVLCPYIQYRSKGKYIITLIYFCKGKAEFSAAITPVFSVTRSFRNYFNLLIWCWRNISCWKQFFCLIFLWKSFYFFSGFFESCTIMHLLTATFDQFKCINFFLKNLTDPRLFNGKLFYIVVIYWL